MLPPDSTLGAKEHEEQVPPPPPTRPFASLPPFTVLSTNTVQNSWTRRSKSSGQSDESFSAYLHHPFSSSPALDRASYDNGRFSAQRETPRATIQHRRLPSLDTVGHAYERSSPYGAAIRPTPQRSSLRDVVAMHGHDRSASRYMRPFSTPWRGNGHESSMDLLQLRDASPWQGHRFNDSDHDSASRVLDVQDDADGHDALDPMAGRDLIGHDDGQGESDEEDDSFDISGTLHSTQDSSGDMSFLSDDKDKKRRRRTNRSEARVLSAVFEKTAFPDQTTREALADRLHMSVRAVSIWFQNRRQAVKKRASRFGGMEGVCGAANTTFAHEMDDRSSLMDCHLSKQQHGHQRLKRWLSLDEVAARAHTLPGRTQSSAHVSSKSNGCGLVLLDTDVCLSTADVGPPLRSVTNNRKSCAPILDLLRKKANGKTLTRIASMPCFAATFAPQNVAAPKKDLRHVLDDIAAVTKPKSRPSIMPRSTSMSVVPSSSLEQSTECMPKLEMEHVEPLDVASQAPIGLEAQDADLTSGKGLGRRDIWKRMKSSSSGISSENNTPESDKENRQLPRKDSLVDEDGFEDEEQTLRRIAMRRASKQEAKREQKLSLEGAKYVQEADARLVLQQQKKITTDADQSITGPARMPFAPLPIGRPMSRSTSEGATLARHGLLRVPSLDFEAGRDRSKEVVNRPPIASLSLQQRLRLRADRAKANEPSQGAKASRIRSFTAGRRSLPDQIGRARAFKSVTSMPVIRNARKSNKADTSDPRAADDSSSAISLDSRTPSEGSSAEWAEDWSREHTMDSILLARQGGPLNVLRTSKRKHTVNKDVLHDDSGFFGSDEASDDGHDENADPDHLASKRSRVMQHTAKRSPLKSVGVQYQTSPLRITRQVQQPSSSPLKKGDERDRLAAETLLAFGSFA